MSILREDSALSLAESLHSVVKIHAISNPPDHEQPWRTKGPVGCTGSGAIIATTAGLRILTNAHVVEHPVFVEVRRYGQAEKFVASVDATSNGCDLALIRVDDPEFFRDADPIAMGELPMLSDRVSVCGFPIGGDHLSVTEGVVSRIELTDYAQSNRRLLAIQIDAAINAGNSGGPVLMDGKLVGVAFQALDEGQNIGYMIALPVVQHFLKDVEAGKPEGVPDLGVIVQSLVSKAHRACLGLAAGRQGVLVTRIVYGGSAWQSLKKGDVILEIDGIKVASDGTVTFRNGERIDFAYLVSLRNVDDVMKVKVWRDGAAQEIPVKLKAPQALVPQVDENRPPSYFVTGGLLFVPLTLDFLRSWGEDWQLTAPHALLAINENEVRTRARQEVVLLQKVLPDQANLGYHEVENLVVARVDRKRVRALKDVVRALEVSTNSYLRIEGVDGRQIVLDRQKVAERSAKILERFGIPADRSPDLI